MKRILIIAGCIIVIAAAIYVIKDAAFQVTRVRVDTLYTYFHKIQDSIRKKNYPINMDSLKKQVHDSMMNSTTWDKLERLEKSVNAYKQP